MSSTTLEEHREEPNKETDLEKHSLEDNDHTPATKDSPAAAAPASVPSGPPPLHLPREAYLSLVGGWIALFFGFG